MAVERTRSVRKASGGRYIPNRKSRAYARVQPPSFTKIGEKKVATHRTRGGQSKVKLVAVNKISVADPVTKKVYMATITDVLENTANRNFIIRDIMNKGALVQTDKGKVKITSRPGQSGTLSGILVK